MTELTVEALAEKIEALEARVKVLETAKATPTPSTADVAAAVSRRQRALDV